MLNLLLSAQTAKSQRAEARPQNNLAADFANSPSFLGVSPKDFKDLKDSKDFKDFKVEKGGRGISQSAGRPVGSPESFRRANLIIA